MGGARVLGHDLRSTRAREKVVTPLRAAGWVRDVLPSPETDVALRRARQSCCGVLILLVLVSVPVSVAFGLDARPPASKKAPAASVVSRTGQLTVEATEERLRDVLDRISRATGVKFHVEESLPDSAVTISLNNVPI